MEIDNVIIKIVWDTKDQDIVKEKELNKRNHFTNTKT